jgi:hypothetical protein
MALVAISKPVKIIILDPILSTNLPPIGDPIAAAITTGRSMKLALDGWTPKRVTASLGKNTIED